MRISKPVRQGNALVAPHPELILVCGYSGIGKTRVIDEVHKPMVQVYFLLLLFNWFFRSFHTQKKNPFFMFDINFMPGQGNVWKR